MMSPSLSDFQRLSAELEGVLHFDATMRRLYATDASVYREMPQAVALPKSEGDICKLIRFAREHGTSLIPRAAGTSLAGQVVGAGIVVDVSRHLTRILEIDPVRRRVLVQPGVVRNELNLALAPHGLFFAPETSTQNRCMIGGMVGNNACGANSVVCGSTREHLVSLRAVSSETPMVGIEPSAILGFRDEVPDLVPERLVKAANAVAKQALLIDEFIAREAERRRIRPEAFTKESRKIKLHGHCHQKSLASLTPTVKALELPLNYKVQVIPSGCCAMAGSFGYEKEHFEISMKIGGLVLLPAMRSAPAELHKLWRTSTPGGYHMEYGYSCMGYEIAGGLGVKMARPDREIIVMVGDGSYLMLNNEIATSVMLDKKLIVVLLDNRGYGCINRLQQGCGGAPFNNMLADSLQFGEGAPKIDFAANAASLGAISEKVANIAELEAALQRARSANRTYLICIDTDDTRTTEEGGWWWEVAVPEESPRDSVRGARAAYLRGKENQKR
jgi:hypothetical protein